MEKSKDEERNQYFLDEYEQAEGRGGKLYADAYIEGLKDGYAFADQETAKLKEENRILKLAIDIANKRIASLESLNEI